MASIVRGLALHTFGDAADILINPISGLHIPDGGGQKIVLTIGKYHTLSHSKEANR